MLKSERERTGTMIRRDESPAEDKAVAQRGYDAQEASREGARIAITALSARRPPFYLEGCQTGNGFGLKPIATSLQRRERVRFPHPPPTS